MAKTNAFLDLIFLRFYVFLCNLDIKKELNEVIKRWRSILNPEMYNIKVPALELRPGNVLNAYKPHSFNIFPFTDSQGRI